MTGIFIADINALQDFEDYLPSFLNGFTAECRELRGTIQEIAADIEMRLDEAQDDYDNAVDAASGGEDDDESWESRRAVEDAAARLQEWGAYKRRFEAFADGASMQIDEAEEAQNRSVSVAVSFLAKAIDLAKAVRAVTMTAGSSGNVPPDAAARTGRLPRTGASVLRTARLREQLPPLPNGLTWVPVDRLDWSAVPDDLAFEKANHDDIAAMLQVFERDVLPAVTAQGLQHSDLVALDRQDGRVTGATSRAFAYEYMIGMGRASDVIAINAPHLLTGNRATWESGRHRAMVAKELGWNFVPARVIGGSL